MKIFIVTLIILLNYKLFYVAPWVHVQGQFNLIDFGIGIVLVYNSYLLFLKPSVFKNTIGKLIVFILLLVAMHIPIGVMKYDIDLLDAVVASRKYLLLLSYFVFLDVMDCELKRKKVYNLVLWLSLFGLILGFVNLYGIKVLYNSRWTPEGEQILRGGVERGYFPGFWLIVYGSIYLLTKVILSCRIKIFDLTMLLMTHGAILLRQTRMVIAGYAMIALLMVLGNLNRGKSWLLMALIMVVSIFALSSAKFNDVAEKLYEKTGTELSGSSGSWGARVGQLSLAFDLFSDNILIGASTSALRTNESAYIGKPYHEKMRLIAYGHSSDLGYGSWLKHFGLVGIVWLLCLWFTVRKLISNAMKKNKDRIVIYHLRYYFIYCAISFVTINHIGHTDGITPFVLGLATLQSINDEVVA